MVGNSRSSSNHCSVEQSQREGLCGFTVGFACLGRCLNTLVEFNACPVCSNTLRHISSECTQDSVFCSHPVFNVWNERAVKILKVALFKQNWCQLFYLYTNMFQNQSSRQTDCSHRNCNAWHVKTKFCFLLIKTFTDLKVIPKAKQHYTFIFRGGLCKFYIKGDGTLEGQYTMFSLVQQCMAHDGDSQNVLGWK